MNRETKVLEMAKDMCFHVDTCKVGAENKCCKLNCETTWAAETLVDKNYQKVGEDEIVISKKDYEALLSELHSLTKKDYEALLSELHSLTYKYDKLCDDYRLCKDANETIKQNYIILKQDTEREVAQKFYALSENWGGGVAYWKQSRVLAKELGVEVK